MDFNRPKITLCLTRTDKLLEAAALVLLIALWIYSIVAYLRLPENIPIHFDLDGRPNGYGGKASLFIPAGAATFMYALLAIAARYPHRMNYLTKITPDNAATRYARAVKVLRVMELIVVALFLFILNQIVLSADKQATSGFPALIVGLLLGVGTPVAIVLYTTRSDRKNH